MNTKLFIAVAVLFTVLALASCQDASCRKKCGGKSPKLGNCRRADNLWRWDGYSCQKMPVACYDVKPNNNAFDSVQACLKLCDAYKG